MLLRTSFCVTIATGFDKLKTHPLDKASSLTLSAMSDGLTESATAIMEGKCIDIGIPMQRELRVFL
jgi:hypothetical protein